MKECEGLARSEQMSTLLILSMLSFLAFVLTIIVSIF